jgi:type IV secretory pathway TrbL component
VLPLLALVVVGYALGVVAFRRIDRERFFTIVLGLVAFTGVASLAGGLGLF